MLSITGTEEATPRLIALQIALGLCLIGWMVKGAMFWSLLFQAGFETPIAVDALPALFTSPLAAVMAYMAPLIVMPIALVAGPRGALAAAVVGSVSSLVLVLHVSGYNDATFVTSLWVFLWIGWLAASSDTEAQRWGARLAQGTLSMIFLGGFLGKLTPEYLSGAVLHDVYFLQKQALFYPALRAAVTPDTLQQIALVFSWAAVITEGALATSVLWPSRLALRIGAVVCTGMVLVSTVYLTSVMAALVGLCVAGLWLLPRAPAEAHEPSIGSPAYAPSPNNAKS
ncbi:MAG: hypothetical protein AAGK21_00565 [Bacteroidota bacterium]